MSTKQYLESLMEKLDIGDRMPDVQTHVLKYKQLYIGLPYKYPGDSFVHDFYKKGLSERLDFDDLQESFEQLLKISQSFLLSASSMGLHHHQIEKNMSALIAMAIAYVIVNKLDKAGDYRPPTGKDKNRYK
jgi:hypothetical protein